MKTVHFYPKRLNVLHIETPGCIVNIRAPLADRDGNPVTSIEVLADDYAGETPWRLPDFGHTRAVNVRVVQADVDVSVEQPETDDLLLDAIRLLDNTSRELQNTSMPFDELVARKDELRTMKQRLAREHNRQRQNR